MSDNNPHNINIGPDYSNEPFIDYELYGINPEIDWHFRSQEIERILPHVSYQPIKFIREEWFSAGVRRSDVILNSSIKAWPQGYGKTTELIKKLQSEGLKKPEDRKLFLILCQEYATLEEYAGIEGLQVIRKFGKNICQIYSEDIEKLHNKGKGVQPMYICAFHILNKLCNSKDCEYKKQFKAIDNNCSIATIPHLLPLLDIFKYDYIYIDENFMNNKEFNSSLRFKTEILKLKSTYKKKGRIKLWEELSERYNEFNYNWFGGHFPYLNEAVREYNEQITETAKSTKDLNKCCQLMPDDILLYHKYKDYASYNEGKHVHEIPWNYVIFDLMHAHRDIKVTHLSASFNEHLFKSNIKKWENIIGRVKVNYTIERNHSPGRGRVVYFNNELRCQKGKNGDGVNKWKKDARTNIKRIRDKINQRIKRKTDTEKKVLILTYKILINEGKYGTNDAFYFGGEHGVNSYNEYDCLVVLGSLIPNPDNLKKLYKKYYPENDISIVDFNGKSNGVSFRYNDPDVQTIFEEEFEKSEYDSINRIRPLISDYKEIYIFGYIPSQFIRDGWTLLPYRATLSGENKRF